MKYLFIFIAALILNGLFWLVLPQVDWLVRGIIIGVVLSLVVGMN